MYLCFYTNAEKVKKETGKLGSPTCEYVLKYGKHLEERDQLSVHQYLGITVKEKITRINREIMFRITNSLESNQGLVKWSNN